MQQDFDGALAIAHKMADAAGAAILPFFRTDMATENKLSDGFDPVTAADRAADGVRLPAGELGELFDRSAVG